MLVVHCISGDALHRESSHETRPATHPKADAMQVYHHDFEQQPSSLFLNFLSRTATRKSLLRQEIRFREALFRATDF